MSSQVYIYTWLIAFSIGVVTCQRPITKELTAVTLFPEVDDIFIRLHSETRTSITDLQTPIPNNLKYEMDAKTQLEVKPIPSTREELPGTTSDTVTIESDQDSPQKEIPGTIPSDTVTIDSNGKSSTQNQSDGSELDATTKLKICKHISSSGFFSAIYMNSYSPDEHKISFLISHPLHFIQLFEFKREKKEGTSRHVLPRFTLSNVSKTHRLYVQGRKDPYIESMILCFNKDGLLTGHKYEYYVSDREYNLSTNPTEYIAGRFLAVRDLDRRGLKVIGLAEQPATVVKTKNEASLYASLKEKHPMSSERKYPIIRRLSDGQTMRLCSSVVSGINKTFNEQMKFFPNQENAMACREEKIVRLRMEEGPDQVLTDVHLWMITCKGEYGHIFNLIQADNDQNGVFVSKNRNGVETVLSYASRIAALTEVQDPSYYPPKLSGV